MGPVGLSFGPKLAPTFSSIETTAVDALLWAAHCSATLVGVSCRASTVKPVWQCPDYPFRLASRSFFGLDDAIFRTKPVSSSSASSLSVWLLRVPFRSLCAAIEIDAIRS